MLDGQYVLKRAPASSPLVGEVDLEQSERAGEGSFTSPSIINRIIDFLRPV